MARSQAVGHDVSLFLRLHGYDAADDAERGATEQCLAINVLGHEEEGGHTWYLLECSLRLPVERSWRTRRRLAHLRKGLHDEVKHELGAAYTDSFGRTPFPSRGGLQGTTARLQGWCNSLAACMNTQSLPPSLVARVLCSLQVPQVSAPKRVNAALIAAGDSVGKSCLLRRWACGNYAEPQDAPGIDFSCKTIQHSGHCVRLQVFDRIRNLWSGHTWDCMIIVYDITNRLSFEGIEEVLKATQVSLDSTICFLVASKADLTEHRQVTTAQGISKACELGAAGFFEVSAKTGDGVEDLFEEIGKVFVEDESLRRQVPPVVGLHATPLPMDGLKLVCTSLGGSELLTLPLDGSARPADWNVGDIIDKLFPRLAFQFDVPQWMLRVVLADGTLLTTHGVVPPDSKVYGIDSSRNEGCATLDKGLSLSAQLFRPGPAQV